MKLRPMTAIALATAFLAASVAYAQQQPPPGPPDLNAIPEKMPFNTPYGAPISLKRAQAAIQAAMAEAEVGDDGYGEDPTVNRLEALAAALLGKEAALFLPSGTMANQVAIATHCRPGDEVLAHESAHIITSEGGAPAAIAGVLIKGLEGARGQFTPATLEAAIRPRSRYSPPQTLVEVEQTSNRGGGACWTVEALTAVTDTAHARGLATHMDGARLLNAPRRACGRDGST